MPIYSNMSRFICESNARKLARSLLQLITLFKITFLVLFLNTMIFVAVSTAFIGIKSGDTPESFVLRDLSGKDVNVPLSHGSNPAIIVFWKLTDETSFQNYSLDELRFLSRFYDSYHETYGLEIYAIYKPLLDNGVAEGELAHVRRIIADNNIHFPVLIDSGAKMFQQYGAIVLPSTVMINGEGKIRFLYPGFPLTSTSVLTEQINDLLGIVKVAQKEGVK